MLGGEARRSSSERDVYNGGEPMSSGSSELGWLRGPTWDVSLLAFGWVPFYLWVAANPFLQATTGLRAALIIALALNFLHRHYVLLLVYGDRAVLDERRRA